MRKVIFANEEVYHIYNRGVEKRMIIEDVTDAERFLQSMVEFNTLNPIGSIYEKKSHEKSFGKVVIKDEEKEEPLVEVIAYCINPNHFHFILRQVSDKGVEKFMQRFGTGYTMYFNKKYTRSGSLFQGTFKAIHIETNEYLLHLSAYVNLNFRVHRYEDDILTRSSWNEYIGKTKREYCEKNIVLGQFRSQEEYKDFSESSLIGILERKQIERALLME